MKLLSQLSEQSCYDGRNEAANLICHNHDLAVAQTPQRFWVIIALFVLEADDFDNVVNLCVLHNLLGTRIMSDPKESIDFYRRNVTIQSYTCLCVASRTFRIFPLSGNTPYRSRPMTPRPETARDLAESPSVRMRVHSDECLPP